MLYVNAIVLISGRDGMSPPRLDASRAARNMAPSAQLARLGYDRCGGELWGAAPRPARAIGP